MALKEIKLDLVITNSDEILATAKRLNEIAKELQVIGYKLQAKMAIKEIATEKHIQQRQEQDSFSINELRKLWGLSPIDDPNANLKLIKRDLVHSWN